jgi:hypothetical protein
MKKQLRILAAAVMLAPTVLVGFLPLASSIVNAAVAYNPSYLISDSIFTNANAMNSTDIQNFLNNENSGLKNYNDVENCSTIKTPYSFTYYPHCGTSQSAATIIYDAGRAYGINPQAIIATLQKEQSLITTPNPTQSQINCAMGYNSCSGFSGFFSQVDNGAWQFRTYIELMNGRNWWGYSPSSYPCANATSLYSTGLYPGRTVTFYNPGGSARTITLANSATAGLYCYTPYVGPYSETGYSGSYNFVVSFEEWFGSTAAPCYNDSNVAGAKNGSNIIAYKYNGGSVTNFSLILPNNTGSTCVESHGLTAPGGQLWYNHLATGMRATDPTQGQILAFKPKAGGGDTLLYVYYGSGSRGVEVHEFSPDLRTFPGYYDVPTNLKAVSPSQGMFVAGDFFGWGHDQLAYILYNGSSGHVEVHIFDPSLQQAIGYRDIVTNLKGMSASQGTFVAGDFFGWGHDQLAYILYNGSSGHVEVHIFDPSLQTGSGYHDTITNLKSANPSTGTFVAGTFLGRGDAQLAYIAYNNTGSGHVETHLCDPALQKCVGYYDAITAVNAFDPTQ